MMPAPEVWSARGNRPARGRDRREVARAFEGREVCLVGLMKSCLVFRATSSAPCHWKTCHFLQAVAARAGGAGPLRTDIVYSTEHPLTGPRLLLPRGLCGHGDHVSFTGDHIREHGPQSLKVCVLIDKPGDRKVDVRPDWAVHTVREPLKDDRFIVGYGLDHAEHYRGLPFLGTIPRPVGPAEGRKITISRPGGTEQ